MQERVSLSITDTELIAATNCAQDALYVKKTFELIDLKVKLPMILQVDSKVAKD
jgi:hypothetical protein